MTEPRARPGDPIGDLRLIGGDKIPGLHDVLHEAFDRMWRSAEENPLGVHAVHRARARAPGARNPTRNIEAVHVSRVKEYIVEYDLPADFRRKRFYRSIKRYLRLRWLDEVGWSTGSVVVTENRDLAWYVWGEARAVGGTAHIYEARRLDDEP